MELGGPVDVGGAGSTHSSAPAVGLHESVFVTQIVTYRLNRSLQIPTNSAVVHFSSVRADYGISLLFPIGYGRFDLFP